jgi:hypothetical protein
VSDLNELLASFTTRALEDVALEATILLLLVFYAEICQITTNNHCPTHHFWDERTDDSIILIAMIVFLYFLSCIFSQTCSTSLPSPLARYDFDAAPIANVVVDSTLSHNGTSQNATWLSASTDSKGNVRLGVMQFSASGNQQIALPTSSSFQMSVGVLSFWMRSAGLSGSGNSGGGAAIWYRRSGSGDLVYQVAASGKLANQATSAYGNVCVRGLTSKTVSDNVWHHVAYVFNLSVANTAIFIDGVSGGNATGCRWVWDPSEQFTLGASSDPYWYRYNGELDDFRIFDSMLTAAQILSLADNSCQTTSTTTTRSTTTTTVTTTTTKTTVTTTLPPTTTSTSRTTATATRTELTPAAATTATTVSETTSSLPPSSTVQQMTDTTAATSLAVPTTSAVTTVTRVGETLTGTLAQSTSSISDVVGSTSQSLALSSSMLRSPTNTALIAGAAAGGVAACLVCLCLLVLVLCLLRRRKSRAADDAMSNPEMITTIDEVISLYRNASLRIAFADTR